MKSSSPNECKCHKHNTVKGKERLLFVKLKENDTKGINQIVEQLRKLYSTTIDKDRDNKSDLAQETLPVLPTENGKTLVECIQCRNKR